MRLASILHVSRGRSASHRAPAILGPMSAVEEQVGANYAPALAPPGYLTLAFDHREFGESMGEPRQHWVPAERPADARNAVAYVVSLLEVAEATMGGLGICLGECMAVRPAAEDRRVKAAVSIAGVCRPKRPSVGWGAGGVRRGGGRRRGQAPRRAREGGYTRRRVGVHAGRRAVGILRRPPVSRAECAGLRTFVDCADVALAGDRRGRVVARVARARERVAERRARRRPSGDPRWRGPRACSVAGACRLGRGPGHERARRGAGAGRALTPEPCTGGAWARVPLERGRPRGAVRASRANPSVPSGAPSAARHEPSTPCAVWARPVRPCARAARVARSLRSAGPHARTRKRGRVRRGSRARPPRSNSSRPPPRPAARIPRALTGPDALLADEAPRPLDWRHLERAMGRAHG
jgi:hypothetical protein